MVCSHRRLLGTVVERMLPVVLLLCGVVWVGVRGTDWWAGPGTGDGLDPEARRGRPNDDEQFRAIRRRIETKHRLAREVIDGRLTLLEAAARFRDLDLEPPPFAQNGLRCRYPGVSDDELHCREVIFFVHAELRDRPGTDAHIMARLEAELKERLGRGDLHLPATGLGGGETDRKR
jgi:hypothetical protein